MVGLVIFLMSVVNFFLRGFVFMTVWNWFPATIFGMPTLSLASALGVLMVIVFIRSADMKTRKELADRNKYMDDNERLSRAFVPTVLFLIVWLISWIITLFM